MSFHTVVWIDHYEAKIFGIGADATTEETVQDSHPRHHIHRKADHVRLGTESMDPAFLDEVANALMPAKAILIGGPGKARSELAAHLKDRFPSIAQHVWAVEAMDHPSDAQLVAAARKYFASADRMHT